MLAPASAQLDRRGFGELEAQGLKAALHIPWVTAGEMACGPKVEERGAWRRLVGRFRMLEPDEETCWVYGQTYRYLRANGLLIGANDLWIAARALTADLPVVTRDEEHFRRVPGLRVMGYRRPPEG